MLQTWRQRAGNFEGGWTVNDNLKRAELEFGAPFPALASAWLFAIVRAVRLPRQSFRAAAGHLKNHL